MYHKQLPFFNIIRFLVFFPPLLHLSNADLLKHSAAISVYMHALQSWLYSMTMQENNWKKGKCLITLKTCLNKDFNGTKYCLMKDTDLKTVKITFQVTLHFKALIRF